MTRTEKDLSTLRSLLSGDLATAALGAATLSLCVRDLNAARILAGEESLDVFSAPHTHRLGITCQSERDARFVTKWYTRHCGFKSTPLYTVEESGEVIALHYPIHCG